MNETIPLNCHASAEKELTFASLDNVLGPGLRYKHFQPDVGLAPSLEELGIKSHRHVPPIVALQHPDTPSAGAFISPFAPPLTQPTQEFLSMRQLPQYPVARLRQGWHLAGGEVRANHSS